jgi:hypothetical protein
MSTDRIASLIRAAQTVVTAHEQDRNVPVADITALAAALAEVTDPADALADLSAYSAALASVGIDPFTERLAAIRHLRHDAQLVGSLTAAKRVVDEIVVRMIVAYIDETGETHSEDIAAGLGCYAGSTLVAEARQRAMIARALS